MRKIELLRLTINRGSSSTYERTGIIATFLQFGSMYDEFDNGIGNSTVAIVELMDGTVKTFMPEEIRFVDNVNGAQTHNVLEPLVRIVGNLEIQRYLVVSAFHVSQDEMKFLESAKSLVVDPYQFGVCLHLDSEGEIPRCIITSDPIASTDISESLKLLMDLGIFMKCQYLKIDRDGPVVEGYETYEW